MLSPLRDSPLQRREEMQSSKLLQDPHFEISIFLNFTNTFAECSFMIVLDFRYPDVSPESRLSNGSYTNTARKSAEEERPQLPRKVSSVLLSLPLHVEVFRCFYWLGDRAL